MWRADMYGKPSFDTSASLIVRSRSRALGPWTLICVTPAVMSVIVTN